MPLFARLRCDVVLLLAHASRSRVLDLEGVRNRTDELLGARLWYGPKPEVMLQAMDDAQLARRFGIIERQHEASSPHSSG